jgi:hypothetical protein
MRGQEIDLYLLVADLPVQLISFGLSCLLLVIMLAGSFLPAMDLRRMNAILLGVGSGNSGRPISGKSVRFGEEMNSDRLVADQCNEGKDDTNADTTRDPGIAERRPHPEGDR